jgi:Flp pilus assembly protein TadD
MPSLPGEATKRPWAEAPVLGLLALLVGLAYANTLGNAFVYDDTILIGQNRLLKRLDSLPSLFLSDWWKGTEEGIGRARPADGEADGWDRRYRPLVVATYVLNHALGGLDPIGYHVVNLLLHAGVTCLLYLYALSLGCTRGAAALAAAVFGVHPIHTEAVAWVVGRPELMMTAAVLAALWSAIRGFRWLSLASFACALLSKEQAVMLPFLFVLCDICLGKTFSRTQTLRVLVRLAAARYGPLVLVLGIYFLARFVVLGGFRPPPFPFLENPLEHLSGIARFLACLELAGRYLWLCVWPASLSVDYSYDSIPLTGSLQVVALLWGVGAWGGLLGLAIRSRHGDRRVCFSVGWIILTFLPVSNVLISVGTPMAERLFYLPSAGLCLLAGLGWERVVRRIRSWQPARQSRFLLLGSHAVVAGICLCLALRTFQRNQDWASTESLFRSAALVMPRNAKAHALLGHELNKKKKKADWIEALAAYRTASAIYPEYLNTHAEFASNVADVLFKLDHTAEAIEVAELAVRVNPNWTALRFNLGLYYAKLGRYEEAEKAWRQVLVRNPEDPQIHSSLSRLMIERGRFGEGLVEAERALHTDPSFVWAQFNRALALEGLERVEEAAAAYERLLGQEAAGEDARTGARQRLQALHARAGGRSQEKPERGGRTCVPGLGVC